MNLPSKNMKLKGITAFIRFQLRTDGIAFFGISSLTENNSQVNRIAVQSGRSRVKGVDYKLTFRFEIFKKIQR